MKYFFLLLVSLNAYGLTGSLATGPIKDDLDNYYNIRIKEIFTIDNRAQITFKKGWPLSEGDILEAQFSKNRICTFTITSLRIKRGIVDISGCRHKMDIKKGQLLHLPPINFALDKTYRPDSLYEKEKDKIGNRPSKNESWYAYSAIGLSPIGYDPTIEEAVNAFTNDQSSHVAVYMDPLGIYLPLNKHRSMLGIVSSIIFDRYHNDSYFNETESTNVTQSADLVFWQFSISASFHHFFGENIGDGWFARGDVGVSNFWGNLNVTYQANEGDRQGLDQTYSYNPGLVGLIGGGYAWPISLYTRLMLNLNYQYKSAMDKDTGLLYSNNIIAASIGILF
ncbi:MAG: hypothetical protein DRQ88_03585 [Epsilonproteobacteria bacterium]|nr:MAG: hypothetical protein DRQ89_03905 [Campylobacterota bacterium]RLA67256.1 MAG: hypothetical protein DRQ88_03585 [Campylobacterota bacterium]